MTAMTGVRMKNLTWMNERRVDNMQLAYLFPWLEGTDCSHEVTARVEVWDKAMSRGREVRRGNSV